MLFLEDTMQTAYLAYQTTESNVDEGLFGQIWTTVHKDQRPSDDSSRWCAGIQSANLTTDQMTLCRATMNELKYSERVKQLRLFVDSITSGHVNNPSRIQPKVEPVFY